MRKGFPDFRIVQDAADLVFFPPKLIMEVKASACELPSKRGMPLSRFGDADIADEAVGNGIVASVSGATVWRWLSEDAIKPWNYPSRIFPRDPDFAKKAGTVLDLYHGTWNKNPLGKNDYMISADEKTSIRARDRKGRNIECQSKKCRRVEFEYERCGALAYIAAWDVHRAKVFGMTDKTTGMVSYKKLADLAMGQEPYKSAHRVFRIADNGSSHRGETSVGRLSEWYSNAIQVHTPVHANCLNQIEICFSIVQRKVLEPNDFSSLSILGETLVSFQKRYGRKAKPFDWKFTKKDLKDLLKKLSDKKNGEQELAGWHK